MGDTFFMHHILVVNCGIQSYRIAVAELFLECFVDECWGVVPRHRLLQQQCLGEDLLRAEATGGQLPLHGGQDLPGIIEQFSKPNLSHI